MKHFSLILLFSMVFPVTGGWELDPQCPDCKYPFTVSLQTERFEILNNIPETNQQVWGNSHFCQGVLVSPGWVLTTGDCASGYSYIPYGGEFSLLDLINEVNFDFTIDPSDIWVEIGLHELNIPTEGSETIGVEQIIIHPGYAGWGSSENNYGLLKLSELSEFEYIDLISYEALDDFEQEATVAGWGSRSAGWMVGFLDMAHHLYENNSIIEECFVSSSVTDEYNLNQIYDTEKIICVEDIDYYEEGIGTWWEEGGVGGACWGDQGAGFFVTDEKGNHELIGNFVMGCSSDDMTPNWPAIFNRTYIMKDWIYSYIDSDLDGVVNELDNCPFEDNPYQQNFDGDEAGDACDLDDDNDGVIDLHDSDIFDPYLCGDFDGDTCEDCVSGTSDPFNDGLDFESDGLCNIGDPDDDNDGVDDTEDNCPYENNSNQSDFDGDGQGDSCDFDDDNDGVVDTSDWNPYNSFLCSDIDQDGCDDCILGYYDLVNDGEDLNGDGICDCPEGFSGPYELPVFATNLNNDSNCFYDNDMAVLNDLIAINELSYLSVFDVGVQTWDSGRLYRLIGTYNPNSVNGINQELTELPANIGNLEELAVLSLEWHNLTTLPDSFTQLTKLINLAISNNSLVALPEDFGNLINLSFLDLGYNEIAYIPSSIGNLQSLLYLWLFNNQLTSLPDSICDIPLNWSSNDVFNYPFFAIGGNQLCEEVEIPSCVANSNNFEISLNQFYYSFTQDDPQVCDDYVQGDVNEDGIINILDIVQLVNLILNNEHSQMADMNQDGIINILDIVILVSLILE